MKREVISLLLIIETGLFYTSGPRGEGVNFIQSQVSQQIDHSIILKVATYNTGMLSTDLVQVPRYQRRKEYIHSVISTYLFSEKPSVLFLQELWHAEPHNEVVKAAIRADYLSVVSLGGKGKKRGAFDNLHGLQMLISEKLLQRAESYAYGFRQLKQGESYVCGFGLVCRRGYLFARLIIDGRVYLFVTFHLTPLLSEKQKREKEMVEIIEEIQKEKADYLFIGADFNFSESFGELYPGDLGAIHPQRWVRNGELYSEWLFLMGEHGFFCRDNWKTLFPEESGYTQDREHNSVAAAGFATKTEPSQRLDQLWTCAAGDEAYKVESVRLIFTERTVDDLGVKAELSDHYGVESRVILNGFGASEVISRR